ncbi:hypothetical protein H6P81_007791 [Aristolochia fimbriata]|uniref:Uncharacterized protein n=1 Tax=Aristolochia fimbriata TaxID=158543 RepID=A0AAV7F4J5_ARIFI|nr:hypothetical protein H6P81_007791 [Aristolochia fimbriata]
MGLRKEIVLCSWFLLLLMLWQLGSSVSVEGHRKLGRTSSYSSSSTSREETRARLVGSADHSRGGFGGDGDGDGDGVFGVEKRKALILEALMLVATDVATMHMYI